MQFAIQYKKHNIVPNLIVNSTMRIFAIFTLLLLSTSCIGQVKLGFDIEELKYTIAMCNSYNFTTQYGHDKGIRPEGFTLFYESEIQSMDNKFQVYENGSVGVINYRGSTEKMISWVENCYSAMIPGTDTIVINGDSIHYSFGDSAHVGVHAGYALTVILLSETLIEQIQALNKKGIYDIITTGHSQGGALATMTRAYLEHVPSNILSAKNRYKTYAYASPMCGNREFTEEYDSLHSKNGTSFSIINPKDMVPYLPFNFDEEKLISKKRVVSWLTGEEELNIKKLGQDAFIKTFEHPITKYVKKTNRLLNKLLNLKMGKIIMPDFMPDINYYPVGLQKHIPPFEYPKFEVDTSGFEPEDFNGIVLREDGKWYKEEPSFYQHKPYNYYVYVLKQWDLIAYGKLEEKYLQSDI